MRCWAVLLLIFAGCSVKGTPPPTLTDADTRPDCGECSEPTGPACDVLRQTGCLANEKCTWVIDSQGAGAIGCAPDGSLPVGASCEAATAETGHDLCVRGAFCEAATCQAICDLQNQETCDEDHTCLRRDGLFEDGGVAVAGTCEPKCDPLTQTALPDEACGSTQLDAPDRGCYSADLVTFTCMASYSPASLHKTDRVTATETNGTVYINSCAPGYLALMYETTGSMNVICDGLCAPHDADDTMPDFAAGNPDAFVKLPTDQHPTAGHGTCTPDAKGSEAGEDCRYFWTILFDSNGDPIQSNYSDSVGYCYAASHYGQPSCADLSPADAQAAGCYARVFLGGPLPRVQRPLPATVLVRHAIQ